MKRKLIKDNKNKRKRWMRFSKIRRRSKQRRMTKNKKNVNDWKRKLRRLSVYNRRRKFKESKKLRMKELGKKKRGLD